MQPPEASDPDTCCPKAIAVPMVHPPPPDAGLTVIVTEFVAEAPEESFTVSVEV
jgi:hypothetical protein